MFDSHTPPDNRDILVFQIDSLKSSLELKDSTINSFGRQLREYEARVNSVKSYIKEQFDIDNFTEELEHVAKLLDITLTKKYDIDISVIYRGTVEIPLDEDISNFSDHIEFDFSDRGADDWEVDIFQYDVDINAEEE